MCFFRILLAAILLPMLVGCSAGVYSSEFSCPSSYNGRCVSLPTAYSLAREGRDVPPEQQELKSGAPQQNEPVVDSAQLSYKESLFKRFDSLLQEPVTPVVAPPQVMRVLLLPYKGEGNELYMLRYVYFFVDEPKWVLGDSVVENSEED